MYFQISKLEETIPKLSHLRDAKLSSVSINSFYCLFTTLILYSVKIVKAKLTTEIEI